MVVTSTSLLLFRLNPAGGKSLGQVVGNTVAGNQAASLRFEEDIFPL